MLIVIVFSGDKVRRSTHSNGWRDREHESSSTRCPQRQVGHCFGGRIKGMVFLVDGNVFVSVLVFLLFMLHS